MRETEKQRKNALLAAIHFKGILKRGDKIGCTRCPGTKRVFIFSAWDGNWMVSKSGINDYHPINIYSVNGKKAKSFKQNENEN